MLVKRCAINKYIYFCRGAIYEKKYNRHIHVTLIVKILFLSAEISMERNGKLHRNVLSSSSKAYMSLTSHYRHTYFRML
jgi:hypothetical protein